MFYSEPSGESTVHAQHVRAPALSLPDKRSGPSDRFWQFKARNRCRVQRGENGRHKRKQPRSFITAQPPLKEPGIVAPARKVSSVYHMDALGESPRRNVRQRSTRAASESPGTDLLHRRLATGGAVMTVIRRPSLIQ